ncbi:GIY-YIG nuclease family protein [Methylobrevis pamukkalensis]|uniref:GIY-YIG nuclease superfamily protein n=1 Tax=Methylobrevis pamukkalensis TaxID=1439726 RepID=A0A1E3GYB6_9HYPH|nr:GIY-YIG nuclease family protein [Methylobrevis pamukkalensis]ODN69057.1 GIY-YIG nuclease superfamily protein [Methylobrevis pamukkalensis]
MDFTVYMLLCADGSYYTGLTRQNVEARVWEHNNLPGEASFTARRRPVALVFCESFERATEAIARERQIKGWSRRKKEALIEGRYSDLPDLARRGRNEGALPPSFETALRASSG